MIDQTSGVLAEIGMERVAQDEKWGQQNHPSAPRRETVHDRMVLRAEADRLRARCNRKAAQGRVTWRDILNEEVAEAYAETEVDGRLRAELVQVAAVVVAWIECIDRREHPEWASLSSASSAL